MGRPRPLPFAVAHLTGDPTPLAPSALPEPSQLGPTVAGLAISHMPVRPTFQAWLAHHQGSVGRVFSASLTSDLFVTGDPARGNKTPDNLALRVTGRRKRFRGQGKWPEHVQPNVC